MPDFDPKIKIAQLDYLQKLMEVYCLDMDKEQQLKEKYAWNLENKEAKEQS